MFGLKFPCINKTKQTPLKKTYSKLKEFFKHTVFQDTFLRKLKNKKRATIIFLASECTSLWPTVNSNYFSIRPTSSTPFPGPGESFYYHFPFYHWEGACCLHETLLHPVYIKNRRKLRALPPHLSPCGDNKALGSHILCNQHEVILQASMKKPLLNTCFVTPICWWFNVLHCLI